MQAKDGRWFILDHLSSLVIKDVSEAGGYGVVFGRDLTAEKLAELKQLIIDQPHRWIAQEVIDFKDLEILEGNVRAEITAPTDGIIFCAHNKPLALANTLLFNIL